MKKKRGNIQLFSFSFVDILATTIGVLLFIMLMAIINVSGMVACSDVQKKIKDTQKQKEKMEEEIRNAQKNVEDNEKENDRLRGLAKAENSKEYEDYKQLVKENREKQKKVDEKQKKVDKKHKQVKEILEKNEKFAQLLEDRSENKLASNKTYKLPKAIGGSRSTPYHVDCRKEGLLILGANIKSTKGRKSCPASRISSTSGPFGDLVKKVSKAKRTSRKKVIVLWIRPDGIANAAKAIKAARKGGAPLGYEPAGSDWNF